MTQKLTSANTARIHSFQESCDCKAEAKRKINVFADLQVDALEQAADVPAHSNHHPLLWAGLVDDEGLGHHGAAACGRDLHSQVEL